MNITFIYRRRRKYPPFKQIPPSKRKKYLGETEGEREGEREAGGEAVRRRDALTPSDGSILAKLIIVIIIIVIIVTVIVCVIIRIVLQADGEDGEGTRRQAEDHRTRSKDGKAGVRRRRGLGRRIDPATAAQKDAHLAASLFDIWTVARSGHGFR